MNGFSLTVGVKFKENVKKITLTCFTVTYKTLFAGTKIRTKSVLAVGVDVTNGRGLRALIII